MAGSAAAVNRKHILAIILAFAAIYTIWGTTYLGIRIAVETLPPFFLSSVRFLFSGTIIFIVLRLRRVPMPKRFHWRSAVIIGALLLVGGNGLVTWSEQQVASSTAALVVATMPLWMVLFDWLFFKGKRPGKWVALGLILGLIGIVLLIGPGQFRGTADFSLSALLILLLAPILWSVGSLYSRGADLPENIFMATAIEMLAGGALLLLAGLATGEATGLNFAQFSSRSLLAMLYLTIFGSLVAFTAYIWLLKHVAAAKVATYTYVNPLIAVVLGWLILSEAITVATIVAAIIIVLAVILISANQSRGAVTSSNTEEPVRKLALAAPLIGEAPKSDGFSGPCEPVIGVGSK